VAYRYGHSTVNDGALRLDEAWVDHPKGHLLLMETFYNPNVAMDAGLEPLIRGMIVQRKGAVEPRFSLAMAGNFQGHAGINGEFLSFNAFPNAHNHCGATASQLAICPRHANQIADGRWLQSKGILQPTAATCPPCNPVISVAPARPETLSDLLLVLQVPTFQP
jgi:hypothetical protein